MRAMLKSTRERIKAEAQYKARPTKRNLATLRKRSDAEMDDVLRAFDARNSINQ